MNSTGNHGVTPLSLLNLLNVKMPHPLYNPQGAHFSNQRPVMSNQYAVNAQPLPLMLGARLGPAAGMMSPMMPQQMGYQMAQMFRPSGFGTSSGGGRGSAESQPPPASIPAERQPPPASIPAERQQSRYTSEGASSILASFGLSNEDLELLSLYPEEQITPGNLPFILRDIQVRKAMRNLPDADHCLPSPGRQDHLGGEPQPSKVIDYGHSSKFSYSEKSQDSFMYTQRTTRWDTPVAVSTFASVDTKRKSSEPVAKKTPIDQRKNPPSMEDKTYKCAPTRDYLPAPNRPTAGPPPPTHGTRPNLVNLTEGISALKPGFAVTKPAWSPSFPPSNRTSKRLPTPTMMNDYSAASPRIFPHTCSLCNVECVQIKDWIEHQNTSIHIQSCRHLRKQFPDWNVETVAVSRTERKPLPEHRPPNRRTRSPSRSRSWSRSPSSWRYPGRSGSQGRRPRSRSPRSRSPRSRSPQRYRRSRSPRRRSRTPQPRWSRTPPTGRSRSRSFTQQQRSSSSERLAKKLIDSFVLAVSHNATMESMVESLAPALMAELAKKKSGPSSASTKRAGKKQSSPPTSRKTVPSKTGTFKNVKGKKGPAGISCVLRLKGVPFTTSHQELMNAVQPYGEVNSATLFKKTEEAMVCMEREEDAKALAECRNLTIQGRPVSIYVEEVFVELPDLDTAEVMLKTYQESPPKIQDCQLSFEHMIQPIDFSSPKLLIAFDSQRLE